jgi:hypothetical protein
MTSPIEPPTPPPGTDVPPAPVPVPPPVAVVPPEPAEPPAAGEKVFGEKYVHELREEAKTNRLELQRAIAEAETKAEQAAQAAAAAATRELTQNLGKALGLVGGGEPPTPEALLEQAKAAQATAEQAKNAAEQAAATATAQARTAQVEAELYRRATTAGADPLALIDSRTFMQRPDVQALDPGSPEFAGAVDAVIRAAVDADPRYRAARVAPVRSGGNLTAGNGDINSGTSSTSVQGFLDEKFKKLSGGKGGKVHGRFMGGLERGQSAEPVIGQG